MQIGIREAKARLSDILRAAHAGERVVITRNGTPWADLVPHREPNRTIGKPEGIHGHISLADAVAPLSEEELKEWE